MRFNNYNNKKSVVCGLFICVFIYFSFPANCQSKAERSSFLDTLGFILDRYYFNDADSALYSLDLLQNKAIHESWYPELLSVLIYKAYVAEHHLLIDSLDNFLDQSDSVIAVHQGNLELIDPGHDLVPETYYMRGMYYYYQGDFKAALKSFRKTVFKKGALQISDSLQVFNGLVNLSQLAIFNSQYEEAILYLKTAKHVLPQNDPTYTSVRDYDYQLSFIESVEAKVAFYKNQLQHDNTVYENIKRALQVTLARLEDKRNEPGTHNLHLKIYAQLVDIYLEQQNYDSALLTINKGMRMSEQADVEQQVKFLYEAARVLNKQADYTQAIGMIDKAHLLTTEKLNSESRFVARAFYEKGNIYIQQELWPQAIKSYQQALLQLTDKVGDIEKFYELPALENLTLESEVLKVLLLKADGLYQWYLSEPSNEKNLFAAVNTYESAVKLIDKISMGFQNMESKQFLSSVMLSSYEAGIEASVKAWQITSELKYYEKAFYFAEKSKANQLVHAVKEISSKHFAGIPADLIEYENELKGRIYYWKNALFESNEKSDSSSMFRARLLESEQKYVTYIEKLEKDYPEYYRLKYQSKTITINDLRKALSGDEVFLEYFYGDKNIYAFGIHDDKYILKKIPVDQSIQSKLVSVLDLLKRPSGLASDLEDFSKKSHELYSLLIMPLKEILPAKGGRITIIPDGPLGYLPFEALIQSQTRENAENLPDFMINKFSISYDYSATLKKEKQNLKSKATREHYVGFSPTYNGLTNSLSALKYNQQEVRKAHEYLGGEIFLGQSATEANFYENSGRASVLHLSLHAKVDDTHPTSSGLYFYNAKDTSLAVENNASDNILHLYELYSIPLNARLAVLSACETGTGLYARGEGIMSLGRAFQYAGCPSVAMSLWQVNDKSTATIMGNFFQNLNKGMSKSEALRRAKLSFLKDPKNKYFTHPYYWSAFVLVGDTQPLVTNSRGREIIIAVIILIGLMIIAMMLVKRRRRKTAL